MRECFSFSHPPLPSDVYQTRTVDLASDIPLMGERVGAENVKDNRAHRREKRKRERERNTNRGRGETSSEGDIQTSRKKRSSQKMKRMHQEV